MTLKFDIMDSTDGIFLGSMAVDSSKEMIVDVYSDKPVVNRGLLLKIVRDRRPTLRNRDIEICARKNSFVLNRMDQIDMEKNELKCIVIAIAPLILILWLLAWIESGDVCKATELIVISVVIAVLVISWIFYCCNKFCK